MSGLSISFNQFGKETKIFFILFFLIKNSFSTFWYFKITFNCGNNYPDHIKSSEGIITPNNPSQNMNYNNNYVFDFNITKHNIEEKLCIKWVNLEAVGGFAFKSLLVNEYDISKLKYEDFFSCNNCNANNIKGFYTTSIK